MNRNLSRKGPHGTPGTSGSPDSTTPSTHLQRGTSVFPIPKPPIKPPSAKSSTKYPPTGVHRPPTPLISSVCGYNVSTGTTRCWRIFSIFVAVIGIIFVIFGFVGVFRVDVEMENIIRWLWLCWYMQLCRLEWFRVLWM